MSDDLIDRLDKLSRGEHDDLSIGEEAAAELTRLRARIAELEKERDEALAANERDRCAVADVIGVWRAEIRAYGWLSAPRGGNCASGINLLGRGWRLT